MSIKERLQNYITYIFEEQRRKMQFDIQAASLKAGFLDRKELGITTHHYVEGKNVVVSLTTYGKRLHEVYLTIESIMQQTYKANKIVLWLTEDLKDSIPQTLQLQMERGLEIRYCEDIRSYKKLIPSLRTYPDDIIITIDDDVIYNIDTLELLIKTHKKHPSSVACCWAMKMTFNESGTLKDYRHWQNLSLDEMPCMTSFPIGCAAILYPPQSLDAEVLNKSVFMDKCKYADDIWFKAMALKNDTPTVVVPQQIHEHQYYDNNLWQDKGLTQTNINRNMNDVQLKAVFEKYDLYKKLK